ncbi:Hypothetical predicted protein [Olea europaea subsp. europaea]|uniref:Uncharacterized protein n=1 Tax=Olea europaea subsp. europaea TaxID=158383 RepID=A0A8S0RP50_OLEEU|nr:Hypothetical predicted protein [Olea europaea subsp. europaea]
MVLATVVNPWTVVQLCAASATMAQPYLIFRCDVSFSIYGFLEGDSANYGAMGGASNGGAGSGGVDSGDEIIVAEMFSCWWSVYHGEVVCVWE